MAGFDDHLTDAMGAFSVNDEPVLNDNIRTQLTKIEKDYETIFSWDIQRLTEVNKNLLFDLSDKVREQKQMAIDMATKDDEFNLVRFHLQLVASYELYNRKRYKESYLEIDSVVKFLEACKFDESNKQYANAYYHIARASNAYIALTLKIDSEKILKDVKHVNDFNQAEKSAICAVKARICMEYPSKGNAIALKFADQARAFHSTEPEWIILWLKAKGRVRRSNEPYKMPGDDEIEAAEILCSVKTNPKHLIRAAQLYKEAGYINKLKNNHNESNKFFKLSSDIAKISIELPYDDVNQLNHLLLTCMECPKECFSSSMIDNLVTKLSSVNNSYVDQVLGLYYLKYKKDYVKAKTYLSRGMAAGLFVSSFHLIKVECLLQPVEKFPIVKTLKMMYEVFQNPNRRLIIISQILFYYTIKENNPKQLLCYLKMYLDEDIEDTFKKRNFISARPLFNTENYFKPNDFLNVLFVTLKELMTNNDWSKEENDTFEQFNKILKFNIDENHLKDNKTIVRKNNESWRKKQVDSSEIKYDDFHQQKNESWRKKRYPKHE